MPEPEHGGNDHAIYDRAADNADHGAEECPASNDHFPDDQRCKADNDCARSHLDIRKRLALCNQSAGHRNESIGEHETEPFHPVGVDSLRARHVRVVAGRTDRTAEFRSEKPIHQ